MNQAIHNIDLLLWFLGGEVVEVKSFTSNFIHPYIESEDFGVAIVKMSNGCFGIIEATTSIYPKNFEETLYLFASKGTIKIGGYSVNRIDEWIVEGSENIEHIKSEFSEEPENIYGNGHIPLYEDLIKSIKDNRKPLVAGEEGIRALRLIEEVYNQNRGSS
jgi:UDP-N-acetyl-2-amino-2-deoxyglucuronate dehydrogenase